MMKDVLHRAVFTVVAILLVSGGTVAPAGATDDPPPELARLRHEIDSHLDQARQMRASGRYEWATSELSQAAFVARKAQQDFGAGSDDLGRVIDETEALLDSCGTEIREVLGQMEDEAHDWRASWLGDPVVNRALQAITTLGPALSAEQEFVVDLRVDLRTYIAALHSLPIVEYLDPGTWAHLQSVGETIGQEIDRACQSTNEDEARALLDHARFRAEELERAGKALQNLLAEFGDPPQLSGLSPEGLEIRVNDLTQKVVGWERELAFLGSDASQRVDRAKTDGENRLLASLLLQATRVVDLSRAWSFGTGLLLDLDEDRHRRFRNRRWEERTQSVVDGVSEDIENLEGFSDRAEARRTAVNRLRSWIEEFQSPEMLGYVREMVTRTHNVRSSFDLVLLVNDGRIQLDRGQRCVEELARRGSPSSQPAVPTPTPTRPPLPIPPPAPTPTVGAAAVAPTTDPDVFGGLRINGPGRIGVGWTVSYTATDHGGRPVSEVSWHAMADNIRVESDGTVVGLSPGRATVMATAHGMRAFIDFEVVAGDGVTSPPGDPPALSTPVPDVVVAPPTPTPTPTSAPDVEGRTTDWAEPTPTPWFVTEEADSRPGDEAAGKENDDEGGGFEDVGTEYRTGTEPVGGETVSDPDDHARPPGDSPPGGGFEDGGTDVGPSEDEGTPTSAGGSSREIEHRDVDRIESPPEGPSSIEVESRPDRISKSSAPGDDVGESSEPSSLMFMGTTLLEEAPLPTADGTMPLRPPPGRRDSASPDDVSPGGPSPRSPEDDRRPFIPGRVSVNGAGQPAAYHIFATCSRLGWAGALATYSVGPADAAIADHLLVAGEHAMWANRTSFPPTPAWPGWQARRGLWADWAARLARTRDTVFRNQIAHNLSTAHEPLSQELAVQTVAGDTRSTPTCDAEYCRLGFLMAWGQQALGIADEARRNGNVQVAEAAAVDGVGRLRLARGRLPSYERIISITGRCADLSAVGGVLDTAIGGRSTLAARAAWEEALRAVMALASGQPPPADGSLLGGWVLADGRRVTVTQRGDSLVGMADSGELFRVRPEADGRYAGQGLIASRSGDTERSEWYDGLGIEVNGDSARGTIGQFGFTMTRAVESPVPGTLDPPTTSPGDECPIVHFDGEIEGDWAWSDGTILRFEKSGEGWVGAFSSLHPNLVKQGFRVGEPIWNMRKTGPVTYRYTRRWRVSTGDGRYVWEEQDGDEMVVAGALWLLWSDLVKHRGSEYQYCDPWAPMKWIGCRRLDTLNLECTVACDEYLNEARSARTVLEHSGYTDIVLGPFTSFGKDSFKGWILEHAERELCLDTVSLSAAEQGGGRSSIRRAPTTNGMGDMKIMGVEVSDGSGGGAP